MNLVLVVGILFGLSRMWIGTFGHPDKFGQKAAFWLTIYKDFAHIYMGALLVVALYTPLMWWMFGILCVVETATAIISRKL